MIRYAFFAAAAAVVFASSASAQSGNPVNPSTGSAVPDGVTVPQPAPPLSPTRQPLSQTTGQGQVPGVPNTSTPGSIGTGAAPSGLPGDSPTSPGFPNTNR